MPFNFENLGEHELKGFDDPVKVYAVTRKSESKAQTSLPDNSFSDPNRQTIRYTASKDGTSIAWSIAGSGPPLLLGWHHLSHLERDWECTLFSPWMRQLSARYSLLRYDIRGTGLSDSIGERDTLEQHVDDMLAVANAAGFDRFPVFGFVQNAAVAISLAARLPERVERLVLFNGYTQGRAVRKGAPEIPANDPFIALLNSGGWGDPGNGFMRAWVTMVIPAASQAELTEFIELLANTGSTDDAIRQRALIDKLDVTAELPKVKCPVIVLHSSKCNLHPVTEGRRIAAGIAGAELVQFETANTIPIPSDPATEKQMSTVLEFLGRP